MLKKIYKFIASVLKSPIWIAIVSALVGTLITSMLDWSTSSILGDPEKLVLAISVIIAVITLSGMIFVSIRFTEIYQAIKDINQKVGITARLFSYGESSECVFKNTFEYPTPLINAAKDIIVIDYKGIEETEVTSDEESEYSAWYETLNTATRKPGIRYKRIVQLPSGKTEKITPVLNFDATVLKHFKTMVDTNLNNNQVKLMTCPDFLPNVCIIIIDQKYVIWEIPSIEKGGKFRFEMDLVIEDHSGQLVNDLIKQFEKLVNDSSKVIEVIL